MKRIRIGRTLLAKLVLLSGMGIVFQTQGCTQQQVVQQWIASVTSTYLTNYFNDQFQTTGGLTF
jgi:hypothetical protein